MMEEGHAQTDAFRGQGRTSRLEYLSDHIFNFATYDGEMSELLARKALEVCAAVSGGKTFDYIKDPEQYRWYLVMCNMPFFAERLEWGTSIRGAWWDYGDTEFSSCGLWDGGEQFADTMTFTSDQWREFIAAVLAFGVEEPNVKVSG
jgi:hypothetical protein